MAESPERIETVDPSPSLDDWMIINKSENCENEEVEVSRREEYEEDIDEIAEIADVDIINEVTSDDLGTKSGEDSDISIIDGDYDNVIVQRKISTKLDKTDLIQYFGKISSMSQTGFTKNVIIICLLAIILAMYFNRSSKIGETCMFRNGMEFQLENKMLMDHLKDLNTVLAQIKPYISTLHSGQSQPKEIKEKRHQRFTDNSNINNSSAVPEVLLQSSLNSLCSIINGVQNTNQPVISNICESRGVIFNLIEFKNVVNSSMREFQQLNNPTINKYLQDMDKKISSLCQSLLDDLSMAVDRLILKVYNKLNKVNYKLNKWVCAVKSNTILYDAFLTSFDKNNVTLEGCDEIINSTNDELKKMKNYVEDGYSSNSTYDFWKKDRFIKYREQKSNKKGEVKKCNKRQHSDGEADKSCENLKKIEENIGPFDSDNGRILNSPWNAVKSTFKIGKSKKPHKLKGKPNKKHKHQLAQASSSEMSEGEDDETRNSYERKEAKYKKYSKKGKKCSNKKCKKTIKYTNKTRSVDPTSHFDERYIKKKKSRNASFKSTINTAPHYSKTIILTTERKSGSDEDDLFSMGMNADWQWERNQAREMYRRLQNEPSDWYFERANSRKHARKDAFTKKHFRNSII